MAAEDGDAATQPPTLGNMTADEWLAYLEPQLDAQWADVQGFQDYYDGKHKLTFATAKFREAFGSFFGPMANNWMQIVVDAPVSRMAVQGFRFNVPDPNSPQPGDDESELDADAEAWDIWQANNLDSGSRMLHTDAVKLGVAYALVSPPDSSKPTGEFPIITPEHASQCFVKCDPENRNHRLAGIKRWEDDVTGHAYCNVYLPDTITKYVSEEPVTAKMASEGERPVRPIVWRRRTDDPGGRNSLGVVPLVPLENKPDLMYGGRSDLEQAVPIQDAVNKYCLDMQVSSEFHAYPQRHAVGWEKARDAEGREITGREVELYLSQSRFIRSESKDTTFGQFAQGDVDNYLKPIEMYIDHLAAQTQTPLYYLKGKMATMSADAMHAQDQGLVDRCRAKILALSDGWEEVLRAAFLAKGDTKRGEARNAEVLWADVESQSLAVLVQAAMVMRAELEVPIEMCWELLGWSPQKIRQARDLMDLPPGGKVEEDPGDALDAVNQAAGALNGAPEPNDPNLHSTNQPGQPSGQAALPQVSASLNATKKELAG